MYAAFTFTLARTYATVFVYGVWDNVALTLTEMTEPIEQAPLAMAYRKVAM